MDAQPGEYIDHKDHDGLNNQRSNLRRCTNAQNCANQRSRGGSSRFKGVSWSKKFKVWVAMTHFDYGGQFQGHFHDEEAAARAYDAAARVRYGEFAMTNFPEARADAQQTKELVLWPDLEKRKQNRLH
jgi:hypothetical protein